MEIPVQEPQVVEENLVPENSETPILFVRQDEGATPTSKELMEELTHLERSEFVDPNLIEDETPVILPEGKSYTLEPHITPEDLREEDLAAWGIPSSRTSSVHTVHKIEKILERLLSSEKLPCVFHKLGPYSTLSWLDFHLWLESHLLSDSL